MEEVYRKLSLCVAVAVILNVSALYANEPQTFSTGRYEVSASGGTTDLSTGIRNNSYNDFYERLAVNGKSSTSEGRLSTLYITNGFTPIPGSPSLIFIPPSIGSANGYSHVEVDTNNGVIKAIAAAYNYGGPYQYERSDGSIGSYSEYNTWGSASVRASNRRVYVASGAASFDIELNVHYEGSIMSEIGAVAEFGVASAVTLVKDPATYFDDYELSGALNWSFFSDFLLAEWTEGKPYDFYFGEEQQVAQLLKSVSYINYDSVRDVETEFDVLGNLSSLQNMTVSEGDIIVIDDSIMLETYVFNPLELTEDATFIEVQDDFRSTITSNLVVVDPTSGGSLVRYNQYEIPSAEPIDTDFNDDRVNSIVDLALFSEEYGNTCTENNFWCSGADFARDGDVDLADLEFMIESWLVSF